MKFRIIFSVMLLGAATSTALASLTVVVQAQADRPRLEDLQESVEMPEKFQTKKFRLLWAREAYRCGNAEGAFQEWNALAKQGSREATYILGLFSEWSALADDGSLVSQYAIHLFRPGDGSAKSCNL